MEKENDILFSQTVKAGQRIYYVDVKKTRSDELFVSLTESKRVQPAQGQEQKQALEKHKVFIYKEDFSHVMEALQRAIFFAESQQGRAEPRANAEMIGQETEIEQLGKEITIEVEF